MPGIFAPPMALFYIFTSLVLFLLLRLCRNAILKQYTNFSTRYYISLVPISLPIILISIYTNTVQPLVCFVLFGILGMIGELVFSILWFTVFKKPIWDYHVHTIAHNYTSWLNFLPWAYGGSLVWISIALLELNIPSISSFVQSLLAGFVTFCITSCLIWFSRLYKPYTYNQKDTTYIIYNYILFCIPFFSALIYLLKAGYANFAVYLIVMGCILCLCEYVFGKLCVKWTGKRLWTYNILPHDHGHFTLLTLVPFCLVVYYFVFIVTCLQ